MLNKKKSLRIFAVSFLLASTAAFVGCVPAKDLDAERWAEILSILTDPDMPIRGVFTTSDANVLTESNRRWPKTPRLGNGDIGVTIDADGVSQHFFISNNDYWLNPGWQGTTGKNTIGGVSVLANEPVADPHKETAANLALNKTVTASSRVSGRRTADLSRLTNGNLQISEVEGWVSEQGGPHWVMIDLGDLTDFHRIKIYNDGGTRENREPFNLVHFLVQTWTSSATPTGAEPPDSPDWKTIADVQGATEADNQPGNKGIVHRNLNQPENARYIRLWITRGSNVEGNTAARLKQIELYREPLGAPGAIMDADRFNPPGSIAGTLFFSATQEIYDPQVTVTQHIANRKFHSKSFVQEAFKNNLIVTELKMDEAETAGMDLFVSAWTASSVGNIAAAGVGKGYVYANKGVDPDISPPERTSLDEQWAARAAIATTILGASGIEARTVEADGVGKAHGYYKLHIMPGQTVRIVSSVAGEGGIPAALKTVQQYSEIAGAAAIGVKDRNIPAIKRDHARWWKEYWLKSYVQLNDEIMNKYYYGALYDLACNIQEGKIAPGINGIFNTVDQTFRIGWNGAYFLNYNFQSTFWGVLSANRPNLMQPFIAQTFGEMIHAQEMAANDGFRGYLYNRTYGPKGVNAAGWTEHVLNRWTPRPIAPVQKRTAKEGGFWNYQKSIGAFQAVDIIKYYHYTKDADFLKEAYPLIKGLSEYWEEYFTKENAGVDNGYLSERIPYSGSGPYQYAVWDSGSRENDEPGSDGSFGMKNSTMDIAYSIFVLRAAIEWSEKLGVDAEKRPIWQDLLDHVCDLPTASHPIYDAWLNQRMDNPSTTLVLAERSNDIPGRIGSETQRDGGRNRNDFGIGDNVDNCSAVFPGEIINIGSDPKWVQIAKNTVEVMNMPYSGPNLRPEQAPVTVEAGVSWRQNNNYPKVFSVAARCGYDAYKLYDAFRETTKARLMPNLVVTDNMHGIEKNGGIEAINSMLIQGHEGVIRLFPVWPKSKDAKFVDLRQRGAFLVSSELKNGKIQPTVIFSEAGGTLVLQSPWETGIAVKDSKGNAVATAKGTEANTGFTTFAFQTVKGERYTVSDAK